MERYPIQQYSEEQHADVNLLVYVSDFCNYNCWYCYNKKPRLNKHLDLDVLYAFLVDMQKKTQKTISVELIGGEPTLHPDLLNFFEKACSIPNMSFSILTNFHKDLDYYLELIDKHQIRIIPTWHSIPTDQKNAEFQKKVMSIPRKYFDYFHDGKHHHNFFIRIMFEKNNFDNAREFYLKLVDDIPEYIESSLVADPIFESHMSNTKTINDEYQYSAEQLKEYHRLSDMIAKHKQLYTVEYNDGTKEKLSYNDMFLNQDFTFHFWKCNAGKDYLYIHVNGNIFPCQSYYEANKKKLYNIYDNCKYDVMKMKPVICQCKTCSCDFEIRKQKIFVSTANNFR